MGRQSDRPRIHALGLMAMGAILSFMVISPVISLYLDRRGLPPAHVGSIIGAMSLGLVVTELMALAVSSVLGRRLAVITALAGSAVMFAWFPLAGTLLGLYLARLLLGAVRGVLWPVAFAEVGELGQPDERPVLFATFWLYFGFGMLAGPALGGWLAERTSLTTPFFAAALISLLTLPATLAVSPARDTLRSPLGSLRALLNHTPATVRSWVLTACNTMSFGVYATFVPLHAVANGLSTAQIGLILTAGAAAFVVGQGLLSRLAARVSLERLLGPAFLVRGLTVAAVPLMPSFALLAITNFVGGVIGAVVPNALSVRVTAGSPREHMVAAMGGFNAAADLGFLLGPLIGGILAGFGLQWAFLLALPVTLTALVLLRHDRQPRAATVPGTSP